MENEGSVEFLCILCGLQGMMFWDEKDLPGLVCPRCSSEVKTPHPFREKIPAQPIPS